MKMFTHLHHFRTTLLSSLTALLILLLACQREETSTLALTPVTIATPVGFPRIEIPDNNEPFAERIELGRMLYYDSIISNNGLACASCHVQANGFTSSVQNAMPVLHHSNLAWKNFYMWDGSQTGSLEDVMYFEVTQFFNTDVSKLNNDANYSALFAKAYNTTTITENDVAKALAQFVRTMISANSKYDQVMAGNASFTEPEARGYAIFNSERGSCYHCHTQPLFADNMLHNIGLDSTYEKVANQGYYHVTGDSVHLGKMRTASLRNIGLRNNFMHDGRFSTLEEVLGHYSTGVKWSSSLDPVMIKTNGQLRLNFTTAEIQDLIAFLQTLTDEEFVVDHRFGKP